MPAPCHLSLVQHTGSDAGTNTSMPQMDFDAVGSYARPDILYVALLIDGTLCKSHFGCVRFLTR